MEVVKLWNLFKSFAPISISQSTTTPPYECSVFTSLRVVKALRVLTDGNSILQLTRFYSTVRQAGLVRAWHYLHGWVFPSTRIFSQPPMSTQPGHPSASRCDETKNRQRPVGKNKYSLSTQKLSQRDEHCPETCFRLYKSLWPCTAV